MTKTNQTTAQLLPASRSALPVVKEAANTLLSLDIGNHSAKSRSALVACSFSAVPSDCEAKLKSPEASPAVAMGVVPKLSVPVSRERYLPKHKKSDAALTFPEKLMHMLSYADEHAKDDPMYCVLWLPNGKSFMIRDPDKFTTDIVPLFFKQTKFSSFTRKLYRWGFRQINRDAQLQDTIIFVNDYFQRDAKFLMAKMKSSTAAKLGGLVVRTGYMGGNALYVPTTSVPLMRRTNVPGNGGDGLSYTGRVSFNPPHGHKRKANSQLIPAGLPGRQRKNILQDAVDGSLASSISFDSIIAKDSSDTSGHIAAFPSQLALVKSTQAAHYKSNLCNMNLRLLQTNPASLKAGMQYYMAKQYECMRSYHALSCLQPASTFCAQSRKVQICPTVELAGKYSDLLLGGAIGIVQITASNRAGKMEVANDAFWHL
eukprot:CAMPEP_0183324876 /NCGR_PEP_ID=MMETSP0160_2-20130417/78232_1 /TAXON_ID=2839 ORGANISM="Odontella Sinensis, Strain Grunow 1884" /NCGR_SAMPLE_ID=MMETSP0160_2 /ASSEMBLY_ACC=CAM_ASM_000250 /LENGTH=427 /DNA_ID=CAMNT_0025492559 /DNA_START=10 /DNA_END=1293 /DNA_ORIENTATION=+